MKRNDSLQPNIFSRRQWLGNLALPAIAVAGAALPSLAVQAAPASTSQSDNNLQGARIFNVRDFGAKGDGKTLNTKAIQAAIDACYNELGGTVLIPAGDFICGTIELKSNVTLHLLSQGRLLGSTRREDYAAGKGVPPGNGNIVYVYAVNAENITIEGRGTIDGNGQAFYNGKGDNTGPGQHGAGGNFDRPHLIIFYQCTNFLVRDVFLTRSAYHCFRILHCKQVQLQGIRIYNRVNKNNDGFHFNDSQYVHITNCDIQCQDDACALFGSNQFVTVTNCSFSTRWSIFRFGSGEAQNIVVSNCLIYETYGCPIKISSGKARVENLSFSNIIMRNVTGPIGIGFTGKSNTDSESSEPLSYVRNISFNGIRATVVEKPVNHPDIPFDVKVFDGEISSCITLNGVGKAFLENISFTDVHVTYAGGGTKEQALKREVPQVAAEYFSVWGTTPFGAPAYGMYARNVKNLTLHNVRFEYENPDARPAVIFDNVQDASITGLSARGSAGSELIRLINSKDVLIAAARVLSSAAAFLQVEGEGSDGIVVNGGDLRKALKPLVLEKGAGQHSVEMG
ncbi:MULTISPECIES: glycoside hydrolase family 28 protein [Niastella]|uniref:Right-handed parallel beta-helix repeat-containing protein n=1 Tax=Niastella soli TaxID=2821487 RepID=A0ABS3YP58_9BACT|nr:glycosyl hydrolase family 28 protein [Niastella soli]MBO9199392.1 right-handed parallel beta-helix repeat-containing protein [Niastella soli]